MSANIHNALVPDLLKQLVSACPNETDAYIALESLILGALMYYRPSQPFAQSTFLDSITERVIERLDA